MAGRRHPTPTRRAAEILLRETVLPVARIATDLGLPTSTVQEWRRRSGLRADGVAPPVFGSDIRISGLAAGNPPNRAQLEAALRGHIARQIARLDARIDTEPADLDSARILRDLGGLKRLLDDLTTGEAGEGALDASRPDLPTLRADIARRYAAFAGERPDPALPGDAAGAPAEHSGR